jgi:hypothetical protein
MLYSNLTLKYPTPVSPSGDATFTHCLVQGSDIRLSPEYIWQNVQ